MIFVAKYCFIISGNASDLELQDQDILSQFRVYIFVSQSRTRLFCIWYGRYLVGSEIRFCCFLLRTKFHCIWSGTGLASEHFLKLENFLKEDNFLFKSPQAVAGSILIRRDVTQCQEKSRSCSKTSHWGKIKFHTVAPPGRGIFLHFIFLTFLFSIQTLNRKPKYEIQVQKSNLTRLQIFTNSLVWFELEKAHTSNFFLMVVFKARTSLFKHHWDEVGWVQLEQWVWSSPSYDDGPSHKSCLCPSYFSLKCPS